MSATNLEITVDAAGAGRTLASVIRDRAGISWRAAQGVVRAGRVRINDEIVSDPAHRLREGDRIASRFDPDTRYRPPAAARTRPDDGYRILHEDDDLVVVDKDAGVVCVPAPTTRDASLADRILNAWRARGARQDRIWIVHRIDRFTSGIVLFARTAAAAEALVGQFERRTPRREYLAIALGVPRADRGKIISRLRTDTGPRRVRIAPRSGPGVTAICRWEVQRRLRKAALLRVTLETGRRNQIRVQLAEQGHPILGDRTYGAPCDVIDRAALHSTRLGFTHPTDGRDVTFEAPLPDDMARALRRLEHHPPVVRARAGEETPEAPRAPRAPRAQRPPRTRGKARTGRPPRRTGRK